MNNFTSINTPPMYPRLSIDMMPKVVNCGRVCESSFEFDLVEGLGLVAFTFGNKGGILYKIVHLLIVFSSLQQAISMTQKL